MHLYIFFFAATLPLPPLPPLLPLLCRCSAAAAALRTAVPFWRTRFVVPVLFVAIIAPSPHRNLIATSSSLTPSLSQIKLQTPIERYGRAMVKLSSLSAKNAALTSIRMRELLAAKISQSELPADSMAAMNEDMLAFVRSSCECLAVCSAQDALNVRA